LTKDELQGQSMVQSGLVDKVLFNLLDQITQYEFYDALPIIAKGMHDLRISLAVQKLQSLHFQKSNSGSFIFLNHLKRSNQNTNKRKN